MNMDNLNEDFYKAYHAPGGLAGMVKALREFLDKLSEYKDNEHYKALLHFLDVADDSAKHGNTELPGMMYGMIWNAWDKLFEVIKGRPVDATDFKWEKE